MARCVAMKTTSMKPAEQEMTGRLTPLIEMGMTNIVRSLRLSACFILIGSLAHLDLRTVVKAIRPSSYDVLGSIQPLRVSNINKERSRVFLANR